MHNVNYAIIVSEFNQEVTSELLNGALLRFKELDIPPSQVTTIHVPGAVEIPLIAKMLAKQEKFQALICLGAVIRGETDHYDYVCQMVSQGCMKVMLKSQKPVIFGVLTVDNEQQAWDRLGGAHGHKGKEAVDTAVRMVSIINSLEN